MTMKKIILAAAAAASVTGLWAVQGTVSSAAMSYTGEVRWVPTSKAYEISTRTKGGGTRESTVPLADLKSMEIPKPAALDKAIELVRGNNGVAAIASLKRIVTEYRMLTWDRLAGRYLVEAYLQANQPEKAYEMCKSMLADDKSAAYTGDLAPGYWQCLLKLGKGSALDEVLKKAASKGTRCDSAAAFVMRGDIVLAKGGDNSEAYRQALVDGYLRVALMYRDAECRTPFLEALGKAAHCFDKLGQSSRAQAMRDEARKL